MQNQIKPKVCVIIPNKNGIKHLNYSLGSLANTNYENYNTILVDDDSVDDSLTFVKKKYPEIEILKNNRKKGFAGAVNTGIKHALDKNTQYVAIFNNDIKVLPEWIELVINLFNKLDNVGLIGYTAIPKEKEELFFNWENVRLEYEEVKAPLGCLYICPAPIFKQIGLFDEDYYMYGEDNDLFARIKRTGYKILQTNIPVWHYGEGSSENNKLLPTWLAYRNALRFSLKNENIIGICRMLLSLLNQGCNPFRRKRQNDPVFKRMRRYNLLFNFGLIIGSIVWNLYRLPKTIQQRNKNI